MLAAGAHAQDSKPAQPFYAAPQQTVNHRATMVKSSDGTGIAVQEWGNPNGPEIVFIHGVLQSHLSFEKQVTSELARDFRLVTYDLRGHGDSDKPEGKERYLDGGLWADDLAAVMSATALKRPVLVGWSMGGIPMGNYLSKFGDARLAGLHFVDAVTKRSRDFAGRPDTRTFLPLTADPDLSTRVDAVRNFLRSCFEIQPTPAEFERMVAFNAQVPRHVLTNIMMGVPLNADDAYKAVKVPVLVTHGALDAQISPRITEFDKSVMPHARVSIYEGCGHAPFWEAPGRFNRELAAFVRSTA